MNRSVMSLLLSLMVTIGVMAQDKPKTEAPKKDEKPAASSAAPLPTIDDILDKSIKAVGGKEAIEKLTSRTTKGSFEIEAMNLNGTFENFQKAPNKKATVISFPGVGTINEVFDGTKGWSANPMAGLNELTGAELAAAKRDSDFYSVINFKKNYPKIEVKGREKVGSSEAYLVEATPAEGSSLKFYFDVETGLLLRMDGEREFQKEKIPLEVYFEDYKAIDGVKIAHTVKQVTPMFAATIKLTEVKHNTEIDETKFNKPSGN
ncbi:MAG: hypothetical protein L0220_31195 [Acidobacteria bacterium]|nr:hypothetical protein [Acidobacteriota bacterium]